MLTMSRKWFSVGPRSSLFIVRFIVHCSLFIALLLAACGKEEAASPGDIFPGPDAFPGWAIAGETMVFDRENIYDLVNGQADAFFVYGFEQVAVQNYENAEGVMLGVEVWRLATVADAYGLFTVSTSGSPVAIANANDGDADPGQRLAFWQDRYYVYVRARQEVPDADLRGFAEAVSAALPSGGEPPALMGRLPADGLVERGAVFFHEEISIQDALWLGGENVLGLGPETDGVLARYEAGGGVARLLLVQYPEAGAASAGLTALEGGQFESLVVADARGDLLGAVFGEVDEAVAGELLQRALDGGS
jgi:hypothetical protein